MSSSEPRYLLAPSGVLTPELRGRLNSFGPILELESVADLRSGDREPGWILVPARAGAALVMSLLERLGEMPGAWSPLLLVDEPDGGISVLPISPGFRMDLDEVRGRIERADSADAVLSFRKTLPVLSRVRHDINNALTSAFAEVQLLLMDMPPDGEVAAALRTVEAQLRKVRDLVAELTPIRSLTK